MIEERSYLVTATLRARIDFAPIERETPITRADAIENAIGTMPDGFWDQLEAEGWSVDFSAESDDS